MEMLGVFSLYGLSCHREGGLLSVYVELKNRHTEEEKSWDPLRIAFFRSVVTSFAC